MAAVKQDTLLFFEKKRDLYPLYETFEKMLLERFPQTDIKVQKSQISFSNRHIYACVSFLRIKKALLQKTHLTISSEADLDPELFIWIRQAYEYAQTKL